MTTSPHSEPLPRCPTCGSPMTRAWANDQPLPDQCWACNRQRRVEQLILDETLEPLADWLRRVSQHPMREQA